MYTQDGTITFICDVCGAKKETEATNLSDAFYRGIATSNEWEYENFGQRYFHYCSYSCKSSDKAKEIEQPARDAWFSEIKRRQAKLEARSKRMFG